MFSQQLKQHSRASNQGLLSTISRHPRQIQLHTVAKKLVDEINLLLMSCKNTEPRGLRACGAIQGANALSHLNPNSNLNPKPNPVRKSPRVTNHRGITLAQGALGPKFVRAPIPSAEGTRTKRRKREPAREKILKPRISEICHFLHFGGRFYRILIVRKRHITCQNLQFLQKLVGFYYNLHLQKNRAWSLYLHKMFDFLTV